MSLKKDKPQKLAVQAKLFLNDQLDATNIKIVSGSVKHK